MHFPYFLSILDTLTASLLFWSIHMQSVVTLFGVLTLPLQYCLCSVTPPPQLTFF